jgi:nitroimidazol reductase NimA-like FMN-containing flavoprotein (pyridoxamine 5'-phosphate oxidase superfamily)
MKTIPITEQEQIEEIIKACNICFLGVADTDGTPYVLPMNFGYKDGVIYLHSAPVGHLIDIVNKNNKVCVTFSNGSELTFQHPQVACSYRMKSKSVVAWGKVEFIEDNAQKEAILHILMAQYSDLQFTYSTPALTNVKVWKIEIEKVSSKAFAEPHQK